MISSLDQFPTLIAAKPPMGAVSGSDGETVEERLSRGPMPAAEALRVAERVLRALQAPHTLGVPHGNISARTVFLEPSGVVRILDEMGRPGVEDVAVDVASVGGLVLAMLTGASGETGAPPSDWARDLSPELRALVERALVTDETRWANAGAMLVGIEEARISMVVPCAPPTSRDLHAVPPKGSTAPQTGSTIPGLAPPADLPTRPTLPPEASHMPAPPESSVRSVAQAVRPDESGPLEPAPVSQSSARGPLQSPVSASIRIRGPVQSGQTIRIAPPGAISRPAVVSPDMSLTDLEIVRNRPFAPLIAVGALVVGGVVAVAILLADGAPRALTGTGTAAPAAAAAEAGKGLPPEPRIRARTPLRATLGTAKLVADTQARMPRPSPRPTLTSATPDAVAAVSNSPSLARSASGSSPGQRTSAPLDRSQPSTSANASRPREPASVLDRRE
jgi:hypothetical protein